MGLAALFATLLGTAVPASAAVYDESVGCNESGSVDTAWIGTCDNVWWNADPNARSARLYFGLVTYQYASPHYRNTAVGYVASTDGTPKTMTYYCEYDNGTSSGSLGTLTLGNGFPLQHDYRPQFGNGGWNPCAGTKGMVVVIRGWWGSSGHITTKVFVNASPASPHGIYAYECTYPSQIQFPKDCT